VRRSSIRAAAVGVVSSLCASHASATAILIVISSQFAVVAADSLANRIEGGQHLVCKVIQISDRMLFVSTGMGVTDTPVYFNPYEIARISAASGVNPHEAALKYEHDAVEVLQQIWRTSRDQYLAFYQGGAPDGPQAFEFIGLDPEGNLTAAGGHFVEDAAPPHVLSAVDDPPVTGKTRNGAFLVRLGVKANAPSDGVIEGWLDQLPAEVAVTRALETQIDAQNAETQKLIGRPVSVVTLSRDGTIKWVSRGACN
jgi:hypothetical protein